MLGLYAGFETFEDERLRTLTIVLAALPVGLVAVCFWAMITVNYKNNKWRYLFIVVEGPLCFIVRIWRCIIHFLSPFVPLLHPYCGVIIAHSYMMALYPCMWAPIWEVLRGRLSTCTESANIRPYLSTCTAHNRLLYALIL